LQVVPPPEDFISPEKTLGSAGGLTEFDSSGNMFLKLASTVQIGCPQLFRRSARAFGKRGGNLMDGQLPEDVFSKNAGPGLFHKPPSFGAQETPGIEKVGRLVIARMNHEIHLQTVDILSDSYHFKEQMSRKILQYRKLF
jgi:hypothetical protein